MWHAHAHGLPADVQHTFSGGDTMTTNKQAPIYTGQPGKNRCIACGWQGTDTDLIPAPSPSPRIRVMGCPKCGSTDRMIPICDEPGCWAAAAHGTPERFTCKAHRPEATQ
jgi:hypothetical protein